MVVAITAALEMLFTPDMTFNVLKVHYHFFKQQFSDNNYNHGLVYTSTPCDCVIVQFCL